APLWWLRRRAHGHGGPQHDPAPVAAGFRSLEGQLRDLTTKIEALRHQAPQPGAAPKQLQQSLDNIVAPLMQAVPLHAIEALNADIQGLAERIDFSRKSGSDPRLLAPIEYGLNDIRVVVRQLKPVESLATFRAALRDLSERLDQGPDANARH